MKDDYLIDFENNKELSIKEFLEKIKNTNGKLLDELRVKDLTYHNGIKINPGEGVYIFRDKTEIILVGKVTSMSFTERIAKHFDFRYGAWFNRLLVLICERKLIIENNDENLRIASKYVFKNLNLVLINFQSREKINRIERLLRSSTNTLNKFKYLRETNLNKIVNEY